METQEPATKAAGKSASEAEFLNWLGETSTPALISSKHDRYYAFCVEFGIAGSGRTRDEAVRDAAGLLIRYLVLSYSEGRAYEDSKKAPPRRVRLRSWYFIAHDRLLRLTRPSLSRLGGLVSVPTTDRDTHLLAH
jgi:hypothetical protein